MNKKLWILILIILIAYLLIHIELKIHNRNALAPETVLIYVAKPDGIAPEPDANCKADIITENEVVEDKPLNKIESMFEYIDINNWDVSEDKGFYELKTGLENYKGDFEIKIVCISPQAKGVSYTILNNTNIPCEIKDGGFMIC